MKLTLGFSPCPNDTFIFDALIHKKIDTKGIDFDVIFGDVEELNQMALNNQLNITKLSYHAYAYTLNDYIMMDAGSALGNNCGPLLIAKQKYSNSEVDGLNIAIPGKMTTANFLLNLAFPKAQHKKALLFSEIENAVLNDTFDAGLIIHENRFTYQEKGLKKIIDLGEFWESTYHLPIPLGGIVIQRSLEQQLQRTVSDLISKSVQYAFDHPTSSESFVAEHAQEMDIDVRNQHIQLYVNEYSVDLGKKGKAAIQKLFDVAWEKQIIPPSNQSLFI